MSGLPDPEFLLRFDDICPTMNWEMWERIESVLDETGVKPILAVVPLNGDPQLEFGSPQPHFWATVRRWKLRGWTIAMHGYQHIYETSESGIVGMQARSEFSGLTRPQQQLKLERSLNIFRGEGVQPDVWVAPSHSFDRVTLQVLTELGIRIISDGLFAFPCQDESGLFWIPQQLWRLRRVPPGTWTVCYHHNRWSQDQLLRFSTDVRRLRSQIIDVPYASIKYSGRRRTAYDRLIGAGVSGHIWGAHQASRVRRAAGDWRARFQYRASKDS